MIKKNSIFILFVFVILVSFVFADDGSPYAGKFDVWSEYFSDYSEPLGWVPLQFSFNEPGQLNWYPVADWEIQTCSSDFSSDFSTTSDGVSQGQATISVDDKVYDLTIALNPELMNTTYTDESGIKEYLFTIGWYIAGLPNGGSDSETIKYKIALGTNNDYVDLGGGELEKEFSIMTGTSGFYRNYTTNCFDNVRLIIEGDIRKVITQDVVFLDNDNDIIGNLCG